MHAPVDRHFDASFHLVWLENAAFFANELFSESFGGAFPEPVPIVLDGISIPKEDWHQSVALYRWPNGQIETVGFCNWIRFRNVYLEGGLCVKKGFYKRLPRQHWLECQARGGVAQLMMEFGADRLNTLPAWFGYCGDKRSLIVTRRVGYQHTSHPYLIAKWFQPLADEEKNKISASVARIGPF